MTISDSNPIKFWLTDEESFNESEICGSYKDCYCEQVNYNGLIVLQFNHPFTLTLKVYDKDGNELNSQDMDYLGNNISQLSFYPNIFVGDERIKNIKFKLFQGGTELARTDCITIGGCLEYPLPENDYWTWESGLALRWQSNDIVDVL